MPYKDAEKRKSFQRAYREKHKEKLLAAQREYYRQHKDDIRHRQEDYRNKNREALRSMARKYYQEHKAEIAEKRRGYYDKYYQENRDAIKQYGKDYAKRNRSKLTAMLRANRKIRSDWLRDLKSHLGCACGENHPACLDFHHRGDTEKVDVVSRLIHEAASWDRILSEIEKCDIMCANCHRKLHSEMESATQS